MDQETFVGQVRELRRVASVKLHCEPLPNE